MPVTIPHNETEKLMMRLYKSAFPLVARHVSKMGGTFDDAKDVFQDALVTYYEKVVAGTLHLHKNEKAYLLGISKYLWLRKFRDGQYDVSIEHLSNFDLQDETEPEFETGKLLRYLETTGQKCLDLLTAFYYDKLPMKQIAGLFGYAGVRSVTVQKYKCLEKVRETVKQHALQYEDFLN